VGHYAVDPDTNLLEIELVSDEAGDSIVLACSPNGNVTLNGAVLGFGGMGAIPCSGPEAIMVFGNAGDDTISFAGVSAATGFTSIVNTKIEGVRHDEIVAEGGAGRDTMTGGPFSEWFNSLFAFEFGVGADTINAGAGDDELTGTDEADRLFGGAGKDVFDPGPGNDEAHGGGGDDFFDEIQFQRDADRFFGDGGKDNMYAGAGNDFLDGGAGRDFMDGMKGKDRLFGRAGNDYLRGGPGKDKLNGGPGRDALDR
jgi:Ca2+-binding RTX toxin-like protein